MTGTVTVGDPPVGDWVLVATVAMEVITAGRRCPSGVVTSTWLPTCSGAAVAGSRAAVTPSLVEVEVSRPLPAVTAVPTAALRAVTRIGPGTNTIWPKVSSPVTGRSRCACQRSTAVVISQSAWLLRPEAGR